MPPDAVPSPATDAAAPLALPAWWPWAAGALGGLAVLIGALALWRRRTPGVLRLAPPPPGMEGTAPVPALPRLDLSMEVTGATRSLMMFTLSYRLTLANRTDSAVSDLRVAVQLACARRNESNAPSPGAAQQLAQVERVGPHQSRSISGDVQLPLSAITPLRQGSVPLFIPLLHLTIEGEGQQALARSFVIGTPSTASAARLHPIALDTPPGSIPGLRAQAVDVPAVSAAA
jgi:hypothetical protein